MSFTSVHRQICVLLGTLVLSLGVVAQPANQPPKPTTPTSPPAGGSATTTPATTTAVTVSKDDRAFFDKLARGNIAEIEAGKLAVAKSTDTTVKAFGQQMADDHGKALNELTGLAMSKGLTLPAEPDDKQKKTAEKLKSLPTDKFDAEYAKTAGVSAHKDTLSLLKKIQKDAKDADLKAFAAKIQPTVEHHLHMAEELSKQKK